MNSRPGIRLGLLLLLLTQAVLAQNYPGRPVRVIVPVPAGGTPDIIARMVMPGLIRAFGQQFIIDNRAGAGGLIAAEIAAHAPSDGYTLFFSSPGPLTILPYLQKKNVSYDAMRDFAPVSLAASGPFFLLAHPSVPVQTIKQLLVIAKARPDGLNYASAGSGTANHLAMELFKSMAGIEILHVPYRGAPQAIADLMAATSTSCSVRSRL
jgi:tripartite-type tricarboxylate transporter receptor subunit TctC